MELFLKYFVEVCNVGITDFFHNSSDGTGPAVLTAPPLWTADILDKRGKSLSCIVFQDSGQLPFAVIKKRSQLRKGERCVMKFNIF